MTHNTRETPWGLIYKITRNKFDLDQITELMTDNNSSMITDRQMIANTLIDSLFPSNNQQLDNDYHKEVRLHVENYENNNNDICFSVQEVSAVVCAQNSAKAPGGDAITADIELHINNANNSFLPKIYNKCLDLHYFPKQWKESIVRVIPKQAKKYYRNPDAYRPISLLSIFAKIFEKLLINRITYFLRKNNGLNCCQFGFTAQKSTEQALHMTTDFIKSTFERKGFAIIISFDISGAFNSCWPPKVLQQLTIKKCPKNLYKLVKSYFMDRKAKLWYSGLEVTKNLTLGCPQGSASGPGFWNIAYDDIFSIADNTDVRIIGFADDTNLMVYADSVEELEIIVNQKLQQIEVWAEENKLSFNANKTQCLFVTKNIKRRDPRLYLKGRELQLRKSIKYLGVIIDSQLSFKEHNNYLKTKTTQICHKLLSFAKNKFGIDSKALTLIYKGAILPIIGYGISVWVDSIHRQYNKKYLNTIQRRIAIRLTKAYRTVSYNAVNIIANLPPLDLWLESKAVEYFIKHGIENNLGTKYFFDTIVEKYEIQRPIDIKNCRHFGTRKQIIISNNIYETLIFVSSLAIDNIAGAVGAVSTVVTTGAAGAYVILTQNNTRIKKSFKYAKGCSQFQSNLYTVLMAIKRINNENICGKNITIFINNNSVVNAIKDMNSTNELIHNIYEEYYKLLECDNQLNISAQIPEELIEISIETQNLVKQSIRSHTSVVFDKISQNLVKRIIRDKVIKEWNERWAESETGLQTKKFFPTVFDRIRAEKYMVFDHKLKILFLYKEIENTLLYIIQKYKLF